MTCFKQNTFEPGCLVSFPTIPVPGRAGCDCDEPSPDPGVTPEGIFRSKPEWVGMRSAVPMRASAAFACGVCRRQASVWEPSVILLACFTESDPTTYSTVQNDLRKRQ